MSMKTLTHSRQLRISSSVHNSKKLDDYLLKPIKAGFIGFITILMIIFIFNFLTFVLGVNEKFGMDFIDMILAGVGFVLQLTGTLLKSFAR